MWSFWSVFFGECSLGLFFCFCFVAPSDSSSFSVIAAHILRVPRCLLALVFSAHILTPPIVPYLFPPSFPSFSWARVCLLHFTHSFLDSTISFGSLLLVTFIHSHLHLHLICFPVVIVISAQYHNTNVTLSFFFPCALLVSTKMRIIRFVNPQSRRGPFAPHLPWENNMRIYSSTSTRIFQTSNLFTPHIYTLQAN